MADGQTIALVTGANKGIGKEITRQLTAKGITVLLGARNLDSGSAAAKELAGTGGKVIPIQLDVTAQASIDAAVTQIDREFGRLDILVNNAGVCLASGAATAYDFEIFQRTFDTNVYGPFRMIAAFVPLLKKSKQGRIVNLSSGLGSLAAHSDPNHRFSDIYPAYSASKTALNALTVHFANLLKADGIKVNAADPGYTATDLNQHKGTKSVEQGAISAVRLALIGSDGPTGGYFSEHGTVAW